MVDVLNLVSFVNLSKSNLNCVKFSAIDAHSSKSSPKSTFVDESAQSNYSLEVKLFNVLIKHTRVGRNWKSCEGTVKSSHSADISREADHAGKFSYIIGFTALHSLGHEVSIDVNSVRVEPSNLFAISKGSNHVVLVVPLETIDHIADFVKFRGVDLGHEHVSVVVNKYHLAFSGNINLVKLHLDDISGVIDWLSSFARIDIEDFNLFRVDGVNDCNNIGCK